MREEKVEELLRNLEFALDELVNLLYVLDVHDAAIYTYVKKCTLPNLAYNRVHGTFLPEICHENAIKAFIKQKFNADNRKIKECLDRLVRSSILIEERGDWYRFDPWLIKLAEKELIKLAEKEI